MIVFYFVRLKEKYKKKTKTAISTRSGTKSTLETQMVQKIEKENYGEKVAQWTKIFSDIFISC